MRTVIRGYRIRVYPNRAQERLISRYFGAVRWLWNASLDIRSEMYRLFRTNMSGNDVSKWLTQWKRTAGHEWLAEIPATCLTQCLRDQDQAFSNFFSKRAKYPRRKKKLHGGTLRFQGIGRAWSRGQLRLPKLGRLRLAETPPEVATPNMVTLSRDAAGRYYVSFNAETSVEELPSTGKSVGVDLGLTHLATLSSGTMIPASKKHARQLRYLRRQQRILARRQKGSKRRDKQRQRLAKAHAAVAQARKHEIHELTTHLVRQFDTICIEDLNVKALGRGIHARSIYDAAFGEFRRQLAYKSEWYGRKLIEVDRFFPSSKRCSDCGHVLDELRLNQRFWVCPKCGAEHDRDLNAARNLEAEGLTLCLARQVLVGGDRRRMCVDGRGSCQGESPGQVLPVEARSGQLSKAGTGTRGQLAAQSRSQPLG